MISRLLILVLTLTISLSAAEESEQVGFNLINRTACCDECASCRGGPSAADLLREIQTILDNRILFIKELQPQLITLIQHIVTEGQIGVPGRRGPPGPAGATGATGARGPRGFAGGISNYAYIYNLGAQNVALQQDITFDTNGPISAGFIHTPASDAINIVNAGVYQVIFSVSSLESNQFALFLDGIEIPGTVYGSGAGVQQNTGIAIFEATAGSVLTLRNHTSAAGISLQTNAGGTETNVNASVTIIQLQ